MTESLRAPDPEMLANVVARRVRGLVAERRMTQAQLGARLGLSPTVISDRLRGVKDFDINELPALAEVLGASVPYLMGFTDVRSMAPSAPVAVPRAAGERPIGDLAFLVQPEMADGQPVSAGRLRAVRHRGLEPRTR